MCSRGNALIKEEKSLKEIHEIREELYLIDKEEKKKLLMEIKVKYKNLFH